MPSWAPRVYRPATAGPSAVKSAFLFDKRSRCDPISVQQMPRFPVMLFSPSVFPAVSLSFSLFLSFHSFFFRLHTSLTRPAWTTACNASLAALSQHHQSLCSATVRPAVHRQPNPHWLPCHTTRSQASSDYSSHLLPFHPHMLPFLLPGHWTSHTSLLNSSACAEVLLLSSLMQELLKITVFSLFTVSHFKESLHLVPLWAWCQGLRNGPVHRT